MLRDAEREKATGEGEQKREEFHLRRNSFGLLHLHSRWRINPGQLFHWLFPLIPHGCHLILFHPTSGWSVKVKSTVVFSSVFQYWESLFSCKLPSPLSMDGASYASLTTSGSNLHKSSSTNLAHSRSGNVSKSSSIHSRVPRNKYPFLRQNQQQQQQQKQMQHTSTMNKRLQDSTSSASFTSNLSEIDLETELNRPPCSPDLRIDESIGYRQETKIQFVVDAVYAFAEALHAAWLDLCRSKDRVCKELKELDGGVFYKNYLLKVNFTGKENFFFLLRPSPPFLSSYPFLLFSFLFFSLLSSFALLRLDQVPFLPPHGSYISTDSSGPPPLAWKREKECT